MTSNTLTREQVHGLLATMDAAGVDHLVWCAWCGEWRIGPLQPAPQEMFLISDDHPAMCHTCVDRWLGTYRRRQVEEQERKAREEAGHYGIERNDPAREASLYDAGTKQSGVVEEPGWVYVGVTNHGSYKIGATRRSVQQRLTSSFARFVHAIYTEYPFVLEGLLHRHFGDKRAHGEYFNLAAEDVEHILGIQSVLGRPVFHVNDVKATRGDNSARPSGQVASNEGVAKLATPKEMN